ncbi:class I SAM-dependent methyltransferase [Micromonospora sp. PLK6-60]|uniref:class I SAM-dependent methyltransferase n=1 Tax=Micromonospora sp. PLK6-60 TaxID=2873383 RepID=UPI001CA79404|nr:class I SAM-dependent methyltransferase [Micromonospora sp. PLK6-60]MBY8874810.1 class I SAM-dependent methyltransferase [Micromonospora sp. PLK6-60]
MVDLVDRNAVTVLDVGCGAGDNAALLRRRDPGKKIFGVTGSPAESQLAARHLDGCWVADLELDLPEDLENSRFDCIVFSHVLEHVRDPAALLSRFAGMLSPGGSCVIAVPNVLNWRERMHFLRGRFEYQETGVLDATHLRFFTYRTAVPLLLGRAAELRVEHVGVTGHLPLSRLRRILPSRVCDRLDAIGCARWPNLIGWQILIKARRDL